MAPKFIMMVGIAGSGKSTKAAEIAVQEGAIVISSDTIRKELYGDEAIHGDNQVYQTMEDRTMIALRGGASVVYDATNVVASRRKELLAKLPTGVEKECVWVNTPIERALQNNEGRARHVAERVIYRQATQLEAPTEGEGWDTIRIHTYK